MRKYWAIILILLAGIVLRLYNLTTISLWHDEAFSALLIKYPWSEMMQRIAADVHPPMYYFFLRLWSYIFGDSVLALRGMSAFFGVATVFVVYLFVKTAFKSQKAAIWAAILVTLSPFYQIQYAYEARMYSLGAFFMVLGAYFLVKALREQKQYFDDPHTKTKASDEENIFPDHKPSTHQVNEIKPGAFGVGVNMPNLPEDIRLKRNYLWHYLGFALCMGIIMLTHYYLLFTAAALCIYALIYHIYHYRAELKKYSLLLASYFLILLCFLPWLKVFLSQYARVGKGYWISSLDRWSIPSTFWDMLIGLEREISNPTTQKVLVVITLFSIFLLYSFLRKTQFFEKWLVLFGVVAPFGGAVLFAVLARLKGSDSSVYLIRYFFFASIFYSVILAIWLTQIKNTKLGTVLLSLYLVFCLGVFVNYWQNITQKPKPGMRGAAKYMQANVEPRHKVFVGSSSVFFNYKYYTSLAETPQVKPLLYFDGASQAKDVPHYAGSALLTDQDLVSDFSTAAKSGDTVWLLWTNFNSKKPSTPKSWIEVDERGFAEVRPFIGTVVYLTQYRVN